jgi:hypothetical protein
VHTVVELARYSRSADRLFTEVERAEVAVLIAHAPMAGDLIVGTGGIRKIRVPFDGRGKSGGARVIYYLHDERHPILLIDVFAKNEKSDLSAAERAALSSVVKKIKAAFRAAPGG